MDYIWFMLEVLVILNKLVKYSYFLLFGYVLVE